MIPYTVAFPLLLGAEKRFKNIPDYHSSSANMFIAGHARDRVTSSMSFANFPRSW
jgi:predicted solute-binding protein